VKVASEPVDHEVNSMIDGPDRVERREAMMM